MSEYSNTTYKAYTGDVRLSVAQNGYVLRAEYRYKTAMQSESDCCSWGSEELVFTEEQGMEALTKMREIHKASVDGTNVMAAPKVNVTIG